MTPRGKVHMIASVNSRDDSILTGCGIDSRGPAARPREQIGSYVRWAPLVSRTAPVREFLATSRATLVDCMNCRRRM